MDTKPILEPRNKTRKARLRWTEIYLLAALLSMAILSAWHLGIVPPSVFLAHVTIGVFLAVSALALGDDPNGWRFWVRELLPLPVIPYVFLSLGKLIPFVNSTIYDTTLIEWDRALLGAETQDALYAIPLAPWAADVLTLAYSSFFFIPLSLVVMQILKHDESLPQVSSVIVLTFVISFIGYFFVPAYGPRATVAQERYHTLPKGIVGAPLRSLLDAMEKTKTDAFPSGHTMVTLVTLACAWLRQRRLCHVLLPIGALLIAATMLLTYHYVVDVLAAIPLVVLSWCLSWLIAGPIRRKQPTA